VNIALTGFMGAGKSTTGRYLAALLGFDFVDTDEEIERLYGPIRTIFAERGERFFRRLEERAVRSASLRDKSVIAVGGGAVLSARNRRALKATGYVVHLALSPEEAYRRIAGSGERPLVGDGLQLSRVRHLMARRLRAYGDCDVSVCVEGRSSRDVATLIARWFESRQARGAGCR
jgi:shikimate kinase